MEFSSRPTKVKQNKEASSLEAFLTLVLQCKRKRELSALLISSILFVIKDLAGVITLAYTTNQLVTHGAVMQGIYAMLAAMIFGVLIAAWDRWIKSDLAYKLSVDLMSRFSKKSLNLEMSAQNADSLRDKINLYTEDIPILVRWFEETLPAILQLFFYLIGATIYSLIENATLTLLVVPIVAVIIPRLLNVSEALGEAVKVERHVADNSTKTIQEVLGDLEFVKAYGLEKEMSKRVDRSLEQREAAERVGNSIRSRNIALSKFISYLPGLIAAACASLFWPGAILAWAF